MGEFGFRRLLSLALAGSAFLVAVAMPTGQAALGQTDPKLAGEFKKSVRPLFDKYCTACHSGKDASGGLDLNKIDGPAWVEKQPVESSRLVQRVKAQVMPPPGSPAPSDAERLAISDWFERSMATKCDLKDVGKVTVRRLNRSEYNNTVRDLTGVDLRPADDFPSDDIGYGFDTIGDVLSVSPLHFELYLRAAEKLARAAVPVRTSSTQHIAMSNIQAVNGSTFNEDSELQFYTNGTVSIPVKAVADGEYRLRIGAYGSQAGPDLPILAVGAAGRLIQRIPVEALRVKPKVYELPLDLKQGTVPITLAFINDYYDPQFPDPEKRDRNLTLQWIELEGPLSIGAPAKPDPKSVLFTYPKNGDDLTAARTVLGRFASRAFRRPVSGPELDRIMSVYSAVRKGGDGYEKSVQVAVQAVLVSPHFLYRAETDDRPKDGATNVPLDPYEFASRISYFLWSSMPDEELTEAARIGKLLDPRVMDSQVDRMLESPKARALADDFVAQWLQLRKLANLSPDPALFPMVDDNLKSDMAKETKLFFMDVLRSKSPVTDLLDADYTELNGRLASFYGVDGVAGDQWRRVQLKGGHRGGILGMASFLTVTSNPNRTSPVKRGKFILDEILNTPPPSPPPGVSVLVEDHNASATLSIRERMARHRADPACAACHAQMDAIGFSLENFDAVGRWRTMDGSLPVDANGELPDGRKIKGIDDLKAVLVGRKDEFLRAVTEKLLVYGLGRGLRPADRCSVDDIVKYAKSNGTTLESVIKGIVRSDVFRKRAYTGEAK